MLMASSFSLTNGSAAKFTVFGTIVFLLFKKFRSHKKNKTVASSLPLLSPPSSSSSLDLLSLPRNMKHHVFPSFHGADVREGFLSHVVKEFKSKAIDLFIDNDIERSKSIGPELIEAIRGSRIAIVLLSKNYASSTWCLDELVEIIKCRDVLSQTVMVIFYKVDPTDVKKQTGDFGKAFRKTCKGKTKDAIRIWKQALAEAAKIAGYDSKNWNNEAEMIEKIATDVSNVLNNSTLSKDFDNLVGMESHMINMTSLLRPDLEEVRMIGIYGPSGIGKTIIARFVFNQYSKDFPHSVFMENVKGVSLPICSDNLGVMLYLQEKFMSKITNHEGSKIPNLGAVKDRFKDKKVLVVLDDVDRLVQLEAMAKETWFGLGSRIIITTQDRKLLENYCVNHTYKVGWPSSSEALQMFCMYAFGQKHPENSFRELAWEVTNLVGELPLGLKVMGFYFKGKSDLEDWEEAIARLKTSLDGEIESILKFSYDALDDEDKNLFLHIACFFNLESVDAVEGCLADSLLVRNVKYGLGVLEGKSLISLNGGDIVMHNLLIQLGREIVRKQSSNKPGERQFLVDTRDIKAVLSDDKADTSNVIGIDLTSSYDNEDIEFTSEGTFKRFYNLQFLRINDNGVNLQSLNSISKKLRFLCVFSSPGSRTEFPLPCFPLPCFPSDFQPSFLVKLRMQFTPLWKLWEGIQPLKNLKWMDLSYSKCLKVLPDLSTAINLCELELTGCSNLMELPSIGKTVHLRKLDLSFCESLMELPSSIGNLINLEELKLYCCSSLVKLPSSIENLIHLRKLDFDDCRSLVQLPSSIGKLTNLQELNFSYCKSLVELPSSFGDLINLSKLNLKVCIKLEKLPSSIGNLTKLETLAFSICESLVELPSSIGDLINLRYLYLCDCLNLVELPSMKNLSRLSKLELKGCSKLEVSLTNINLESLKELDLTSCSLLKISSVVPLLSELELSSCETQELSPWIGRISLLRRLVLNNMKNLVSLPQLPYSIEDLGAVNCKSLERLDCSFRNPDICFKFARCNKLNQEARDLIIHTRTNKYVILPGGEVPTCFPYRASGSSLTVKLNQKPLHTSTKFKACVILNDGRDPDFSFNDVQDIEIEVYCNITSKQNVVTCIPFNAGLLVMEHLYIFEVEVEESTSTELVFEFEPNYGKFNTRSRWKITKCGVMQLLEVPSCDEQYKRFKDGNEDSDMEKQISKRKVHREACGE